MTIERKVKYVASDGTEHDSPQEAAECNFRLDICMASGLPRAQAEMTARYLAENPEALRDAVNAYFEALEEHADEDERFVPDPDVLRVMMRDGVISAATPEEACLGTDCTAPVAPGVRGFEMTVPAGSELPPRSVDVSPLGDPNDPNDPSTWRADLPVDHPNYCKPFGSNKEDV